MASLTPRRPSLFALVSGQLHLVEYTRQTSRIDVAKELCFTRQEREELLLLLLCTLLLCVNAHREEFEEISTHV